MPTVEETPCPACGGKTLELATRLVAKKPGTYSVAGVQPKVVATQVTVWRCTAQECDAQGPAAF